MPTEIIQDSLSNGEVFRMVFIQGGEFLMGDTEEVGFDNEQPVHPVLIDDFAMSMFPVTFAEYDRFADATKRYKPSDEGWGRGNRPVINVTWHDAVAYTKWLSQETGQNYNLATEAQWEYVAKQGKTQIDSGSNCSDYDTPWSGQQTSPVGSFEPNSFGLFDLLGNVWEWTCSAYEDKYKGAEQSFVTTYPESIVLRGGSWRHLKAWARSTFRYRYQPTSCTNFMGFRVVRAV
jgi:formylglycine-generating enzyme required for sulfatase activity